MKLSPSEENALATVSGRQGLLTGTEVFLFDSRNPVQSMECEHDSPKLVSLTRICHPQSRCSHEPTEITPIS
jgi:hypothetical protein